MNSLDDLRSTLITHARGGEGLDPVTRSRQITQRIRTTRRRRAAAGGVAAVAVFAAGSALLLPSVLGDGSDDSLTAARTMLGDVAPLTRDALGLTYTFDKSRSSATASSVEMTPRRVGDEAPLLSWTTTDPEASITVTGTTDRGHDAVLWTSTRSDFTDHVVLDAWGGGPVTISSSEPGVGVAAYTFDPDAPIPGLTAHGVTFRSPVTGRPLLSDDAADIKAGVSSVSLTRSPLAGSTGEVTISTFCSGLDDADAADEIGVEVLLNGDPVAWSGGCSDEPAPSRTWGGITIAPADDDRHGALEVRLTEGSDNARPYEGSVEDVVLGVAVYEPYQFVTVGEVLSDETLEWGGHLWRVDRTVRKEGPGRTITALDPPAQAQGPHLLAALAAGDLTHPSEPFWGPRDAFRITVDGEQVETPSLSTQPEGVATAPTLLPPGTERIALDTHAPGVEESALLIYTRVD